MKTRNIFSALMVAAVLMVSAQMALAYTVTITAENGGNGGGEFTLKQGESLNVVGNYSDVMTSNKTNGSFQTFCLESNEHISIGSTYTAALNYAAV